jgi:hypothetical protein
MIISDGRSVAWLVGAGAMVTGIGLSGCASAGAVSARRAALPSSASIEVAERKIELASSGDLPAGAGTTADFSPSARDSGTAERRRTVLAAGAATAGLAALAGTTFAIVARVKWVEADDKAEEMWNAGGTSACAGGQRARECAALRRMREETDTFLSMTLWSLLGAGVIELAIGVYGATAPSAKGIGGLRISPAVGTQSAAMTAGGEF